MPFALWALAFVAFGIGTTEFIIAGLLSVIAADFNITIPVASYLATSYALGVFVGAPALIILGAKIPRKAMLVYLMALFVIGNLVTAFAPTLGMAILGRSITSMTHGAFFGIGSIIAADSVPPSKRVTAILAGRRGHCCRIRSAVTQPGGCDALRYCADNGGAIRSDR